MGEKHGARELGGWPFHQQGLPIGHHVCQDTSEWRPLWFEVVAVSYIWVKEGYFFMESV